MPTMQVVNSIPRTMSSTRIFPARRLSGDLPTATYVRGVIMSPTTFTNQTNPITITPTKRMYSIDNGYPKRSEYGINTIIRRRNMSPYNNYGNMVFSGRTYRAPLTPS